jgi:TfoX/Sxy family transcriptional regulator of competence genes
VSYNEQLAERIREHLAATEDLAQLREQKMFGGIAFMWRGNMLVGVHEDRLLIRVPREETDAALKQPRVHPFDITGRPMSGWLSIEADAAKTARDLARWIARSRAHVATLPPK